MLLAYIDEIGATGAFIHPRHPRYADSPVFGYGGFIIPEWNAREFGALFAAIKMETFCKEIPQGDGSRAMGEEGIRSSFCSRR